MNVRRHRRRRGGFTLIEVLLVMAILVVLGSLVAMSFTNVLGESDRNAAKSQIGLFKTPLSMYQLHLKQFPATSQGLEALVTPPGDQQSNRWQGPYLEEAIPLDPWGRPYQYLAPGKYNPQSYDVWSLGPDGADGTEDDIGNWQQG